MIEFIFFAAYNLFERIYWHFKYGQKDNFVLMTSIDTNRKVIVLNINWHQTGGVEWSCTKPVASKNLGCNYLWGPGVDLRTPRRNFCQRPCLLDKVESADIRESLNIESLLLRLERSQLRWYGHVTRMSQERTAKKLLCSTPIGRRPRGRPRTRWRDYVEDLSWSRLGIPAEHLSFVAEDRGAWRLQLELLPPRPPKDKRVQKID